MPGSDRGNRPTPIEAALCVIAIGIFCYVVWGIGNLGGQEREKRHNAAYTYQQKAKETAQRECVGTEPARVFECVTEKYEAADETQRGEQDLTAQQQAAWGSMTGSLWSFLMLGTTIIGTLLIYQQVRLTREAVEDTGKATLAMVRQNELVEHAQRPWLVVTAAPQKIVKTEHAIRFYYTIGVENVGATVANDMDVRHEIVDARADPTSKIERQIAKWQSRRDYGSAIMPGEKLSISLWSFQAPSQFGTEGDGRFIYPALLIYVRYRIPTDTLEHVSRRVFRLSRTNPRDRFDTSGREGDPVVTNIDLRHATYDDSQFVMESFGGVAT